MDSTINANQHAAGAATSRAERTAPSMTRARIGVLRGIRAGALLATAALVALTVWFLRHDAATSTPFWVVALYASALLVVWRSSASADGDLVPDAVARRVTALTAIAVLSVLALTVCAGASARAASTSGFFPGYPVTIGATCLGSGVLAGADMLLRTHPARRLGGPHDIARWRPLASGDTSRVTTALTCLVALVLILAVALAPTWAARPIQQFSPEPTERDTTPTTVAGDLAWTLDLDEKDTLAAGAAGPILVTGTQIRGLDPTDGSTRWTYHRPNAELLSLGNYGEIITGPDHRYAAFNTRMPQSILTRWMKSSVRSVRRTLVTVLDTLTGRVVAERTITSESTADWDSVQLTDTAALIGTEAIDLTTGKTLWTLPDSGAAPNYAGPAGHSTFILHREVDTSVLTASLVLAPQDDPDRTTALDDVSLNDHDFYPLFIDGWTIRYTEEPTYDDGGPAAAINIDEVAAAGGTDGVQRINLGQTMGPDYRRSHTSLIATASDSSVARSVTRPATVFDPVTRTREPRRAVRDGRHRQARRHQ